MAKHPAERDPLADWFERLVKYKMTALAIPTSGMAVAGAILTLSEILSPRVQALVEDVGLALMGVSALTFTVSMVTLVARSLSDKARLSPPKRKLPPRDPAP